MTKTKAIILACSSLILGIVIGGGLVGYWTVQHIKFAASSMKAVSYTGAAQSVMRLDYLRRGDAQFPIESLEVQLDGELIGL